MRDYVFFPLAALAMAAMVLFAVAPGPEHRRQAIAAIGSPAAGLLMEGETLAAFQVPEGLSLDLFETPGGETAARAAAFRAYDSPPLSAGIFMALPADFEQAFGGRTVRISIEARRPPDNGSPRFLIGYFGGDGQEAPNWQEAEPSLEVQTYEFEWRIPPVSGADDADYIGIWPDPEGQGRAIDIFHVAAWAAGNPSPVTLRRN